MRTLRMVGCMAAATASAASAPPARADENELRSRFALAPIVLAEPAHASDFALDGRCRKIAGAIPVGARAGRKRCEATLAYTRDLSPELTLRLSAGAARERARGAGPRDLGWPGGSYSQDFGASLATTNGWSFGGGYFDHGGWTRGRLATTARQMNAGDEEARRGVALRLGWSRADSDASRHPVALSLTVDRAALGSQRGEPGAARDTGIRLALDTRF